MFSLAHIVSIIVLIVTIFFLTLKLKTISQKQVTSILKVIALVIFILNPLNWFWEIATYGGIDLATSLPLHLCSLYWLLFPFAIFSKKENGFKQAIFANCATIGLISGVLGYLMNVHLNAHPFFSFPVMRSLAYHYLMILASVLLLACKIYKPKKSDVITFFIPVVVLVFVCIGVEAAFGYEYCYVRDGSNTILTLVSGVMPRFLYVFLLYLTLYVSTVLVFYRKFAFDYISKLNKKS